MHSPYVANVAGSSGLKWCTGHCENPPLKAVETLEAVSQYRADLFIRSGCTWAMWGTPSSGTTSTA